MIQDLETEKSILAAIFEHGKDAFIEVSDIVSSESFKDQTHQVFYSVLSKCMDKSDKVDIPIFLSSAHELGLDLVVKEQSELTDKLRDRKCELRHVRDFAKKIARLHIARVGQAHLRAQSYELEKVTGEESATEIIGIIEKAGYEVQRLLNSNEEGSQLIGSGIKDYIEELIKHPNIEVGVPTGYKWFDKAIGGGLRPGGYTLFGARPKAGKTSFALNVAMFVASKLKMPVLFLDSEMTPRQHWCRMISNKTSIPISTVEHSRFTGNKSFVEQIRLAGNSIDGLPITHQRIAGKDFDEIIAICRRWVTKTVGFNISGQTKNCLIVYDYFKLMDPKSLKNLKEWEILGYAATKLSDFLGDFNIPCLAMVQLNKERDIAQSDRLIWLALAVAALFIKTPEEIVTDGYENGNRKIITPDNYIRFGGGLDPDDYINLDFNGECCQITELGTALEAKQTKQIGKAGFKTEE